MSARLSPKCTSSVDRTGKGTAPVDAHESGRHVDEIQKGKNWVLLEALCLLEGSAIVRTLEPKMHIIS